MSYGGITGLLGGVYGFMAGFAMSGFYLKMFLQYFLLPEITNTVEAKYMVNAFIMAVGGGGAGAFFGAVKTLSLTPSEAMRPENPKPIKHDIVGSIKFLSYILTSRGSMAWRSITRNWMRSAFVVTGVTFSFGLLALSGGMDSMVDRLIMSQFTEIQVYDVKISLIRPSLYDQAVEDAYAIEHVTRAEGYLELPGTLSHRHLSEGVMLSGIDQNGSLYRIVDTNKKTYYPPPTDGVILTNSIADKLNVSAGDVVTLASPLLAADIDLPITRVIEQNLGGGCYMELGALAALYDMPRTVTSVLINTDDLAYLKEYLKGGKNAAAIEDKESTLQKYQDMMGMYSSIYLIMQIMCAAVAFAIIYNTATISLSERKREYATLRVLGMTIKEVCEIMNFEYWTLSVVGMALGIPFTVFLNQSINVMLDTSMMSMPSSLPTNSYAVGAIGCIAAVMLSNYSAKGRIRKFDMVEVLKERD
jgi:putative ABC transport system permease protein